MRDNVIDWSTQQWVRATGRRLRVADVPWLDGPIGKPEGIGRDFFDRYAAERRLQRGTRTPAGLLLDFESLRGPAFDPHAVHPDVVNFYTRTSEYGIDAWAQWCGAFWPFGWALAAIFSRRLQQLNVPLRSLDTSRGMTSRVIPYADGTGHLFTGWVRELVGTGNVIYAGAYGVSVLPDGTPCVRVVFPLPNGNAIVIMRPSAGADGSLTLTSSGRGFGDCGFYFTVHDYRGAMWARYLKTFRETIHVYPSEDGVRADHDLTIWRTTFLRVHYKLRRG